MLTKLIHFFLRIYWFIFRPETRGVKCVIVYENKILLIKNTYGQKDWTLPGGGMKKSESPEVTAAREVLEETGTNVYDIKVRGSFISEAEYKKDTIIFLTAKTHSDKLNTKSLEIKEAGWFPIYNLPTISNHTNKILREIGKDLIVTS